MKELQKHRDAFDQYFMLKQKGEDTHNALIAVGLQCGCSERTIYNWKKCFKWDAREAVRAGEIQKEVQKKGNSLIVDNKVKYLSYYHQLLDNLRKNFDIKIENVTDLKKVVDGCLVLQGEASEHIEQNSQQEVTIYDRIKKRAEYYKQLDRTSKGID